MSIGPPECALPALKVSQVYTKDPDTQILGLSSPGPPSVFLPHCTFGALCPGSAQPSSPCLSTNFSTPPAGVADSLPGFHHEVDTVWNFTVFAWVACLPGWQWVGEKRRMGEHFSHWFVSTMRPAWYCRIHWFSFITWHSAIEYSGPCTWHSAVEHSGPCTWHGAIEHRGPLRREALRSPKNKPEADWYLTLPKPHMYNNYDTV